MARVIAFGPDMPGWGSWDWIGADLCEELSQYFSTYRFRGDRIPPCDVAIFIKHAPPADLVKYLSRTTGVVYCPVDYYGSAAEIDSDDPMLRSCVRVVVHCERLRRYFEPYAPVVYMDHHVKFVAPLREQFRPDGFILWVGVRSNLPPLVHWVNRHPLPSPLRLLTNPERPGSVPRPAEFGFSSDVDVEIEEWTADRHVELTAAARAVIDVKDSDFRSRHKPPAKGIDFIASAVPLAMEPDTSTAEHLARMGFDVASPLDTDRWFSRDYWEETRLFGTALRELYSRRRIGLRFKRFIDEVLVERRAP